MKTNNPHMSVSRRDFLKMSLAGMAGAAAFPAIVPASVFGQSAPSKKIHIAQIGCGRIARSMDLPGVLKHDIARVVAVCDVDSKRVADGRKQVEEFYAKKAGSQSAAAVKVCEDYRELLSDPGIDAVSISTPEHWHAEQIIAAAMAGKDVYVQKPLTMTIAEGRAVSDVMRAKKRAFQIGSQQRSAENFRLACELVRNGRIGKLQTVRVGLPTDPAGGNPAEMPVPPNLNYDLWLGCTPMVPYTEERVHPQHDYSRPGWLRIESYCLGMITGWGSHHIDIGHWGMDTELTGPIEIEGKAEFPKEGLWDVHGAYHIEAKYANGVMMLIDNNFPNGVRFEGTEGWIFVTRGNIKRGADGKIESAGGLTASDAKILNSTIGPREVHLYKSADHHLDWLNSIRTRKPAVTTPEQAHRSTTACILGWAAMKLGRKLKWNPAKEEFVKDAEANALRARAERAPYGVAQARKRA
jgi:myo-inositol 2-dehydrogenase / D-chiro-inositol 1-dehydrogenase